MQTFLIYDVSKFWSDLPNEAIISSIGIGEIYDIFTVIQLLCTVYLKN